MPASVTITPVLVAELLADGELLPVYVRVIEYPDARVLVDTGLTELHLWWRTWIHAWCR